MNLHLWWLILEVNDVFIHTHTHTHTRAMYLVMHRLLMASLSTALNDSLLFHCLGSLVRINCYVPNNLLKLGRFGVDFIVCVRLMTSDNDSMFR